ncbi:MAG TPA: UvrD-helicase domain-containing protein [Gemmatimonadaceae bacterium]
MHKHAPTQSQTAAIEATSGPTLVLAGPGAGKTYCLIERVRFLIESVGVDPGRICVFTFTNKAAGEIAERLTGLGGELDRVKRGTIHSFCAELLREFGEEVGLQPGFNIADERYQESVLRKLRVPSKKRKGLLTRFARYRFCGTTLGYLDRRIYSAYQRLTLDRNVADFDTLILKAAQLFRIDSIAEQVRARWDEVLIDEFQDLNQIQYAIVRRLALEHRHLFAVGDDEQSVYSWAGADPRVFGSFQDDFAPVEVVHLEDNHRCPQAVLDPARKLISLNAALFANRTPQRPTRESGFPIIALSFADEEAETRWLLQDLRRDRLEHDGALQWGDVGIVYRKHKIGAVLESAFLNAGIPCCLAQGHALSDDDVVRYLIAALRVIANPQDTIHHELFYETVLPPAFVDTVRAEAERDGRSLLRQLEHVARNSPAAHPDAKKIWRGHYALRNLEALGKNHRALGPLVEAILSEKVGTYRTVLEEHHDELSDPAAHEDVAALAERIRRAVESGAPVWIPRVGGVAIPARRILQEMGVSTVEVGGAPSADAVRVTPADLPSLGFALGLFKTAQLLRSSGFEMSFSDDFTAIDLETTDKDVESAEIVELAAVRVRHGRIVDEFRSLVKPRVPIAAAALRTHHISESVVADAPYFEEVWDEFRAFCGSDVLIAHNGYKFDFPILRRMSAKLPRSRDLCIYDTLPLARTLHPTTSAKLEAIARLYGVRVPQWHRALDDSRALARLFPALCEVRTQFARKTALVNLLDQLGVALALSERSELCDEAQKFLDFISPYSLGRYSDCLDCYAREREEWGDPELPTVDELITLLGGHLQMERVRAERTAQSRYPEALGRLRRLIEACERGELPSSICAFLERAMLSQHDGAEARPNRVNLLTMHSTKGLEFSRVYIVGVEDEQLIPIPRDGTLNKLELEEARRLLYVGMTRTKDRLVMTRAKTREGKSTGGSRFLDEIEVPVQFI